jgi:DMSO/TMAO reductase YedYZ molybdopterin-dependent catalytic subunit
MFSDINKRRDVERKVKEEGRLPPGQSATLKFPVLHYGPIPTFDPSTWDFKVWGEVEEPAYWDWEAFQKLPRMSVKMDIHCVTRWSKFDTTWEGVSLKALVQAGLIRLKSSAAYLVQHCEYGYTTNMPLSVAMGDNFLMATHFNGEPLTPDHGFPLRGVVGKILGRDDLKDVYLWKGGKWLRGLEFTQNDQPGFWERAGYHNEADIWLEQRTQGY